MLPPAFLSKSITRNHEWVSEGVVVVVIGTFAGCPAPRACVDKAWGSG